MAEYDNRPSLGNWHLMDYVRKNSGLRKNAQLIAMHIAGEYYGDSGYASISTQRLAEVTGLAKRTVIVILAEILASGEWKASKKQGCGTRYYPVIPKLSVKQPVFIMGESPMPDSTEPDEESLEPELVGTSEQTHLSDSPDLAEENIDLFSDTSNEVMEELLPLYDKDYQKASGVPANILRAIENGNAKQYAERLHSRIPLATRRDKKNFTVENLETLYKDLAIDGYPLEVIDILMWIQCEERDALNEKFMSFVLSRCVNPTTGVFKPAYHDFNNPALIKASRIWDVYSQRELNDEEPKWVEYI